MTSNTPQATQGNPDKPSETNGDEPTAAALSAIYNVFAELHFMNYHTDANEAQWEHALLNAHTKVRDIFAEVNTAASDHSDTTTTPIKNATNPPQGL